MPQYYQIIMIRKNYNYPELIDLILQIVFGLNMTLAAIKAKI